MKITGAWIDDPMTRGVVDFPELWVMTDAAPEVSISPEKFGGDWTVGKYGPFVKYSCSAREVDAGDFNIRFRGRFPVIVDVTLAVDSVEAPVTQDYALPLTRARQLLRKYEPGWKLLLNDRAAEKEGSLLWLPSNSNLGCRAWDGTQCCGSRPARPIRVNEVDMPLCEAHVREHNDRHAQKRTAKAS